MLLDMGHGNVSSCHRIYVRETIVRERWVSSERDKLDGVGYWLRSDCGGKGGIV